MDCAVGTGNQGCNGGNVEITYRWMLANNAKLMAEASYPYTARQSSCRYSPASGVQGIGYAYPSLPVWSRLKAQMVRFSRFFIPHQQLGERESRQRERPVGQGGHRARDGGYRRVEEVVHVLQRWLLL